MEDMRRHTEYHGGYKQVPRPSLPYLSLSSPYLCRRTGVPSPSRPSLSAPPLLPPHATCPDVAPNARRPLSLPTVASCPPPLAPPPWACQADPVIERFWRVLFKFTKEEKALFVQFVTGTSKVRACVRACVCPCVCVVHVLNMCLWVHVAWCNMCVTPHGTAIPPLTSPLLPRLFLPPHVC